MGLAEAFCLVPATSFGCSGVECGRVLREDRGAPSGWFAAIPATGDGAVHSSKTKLGGRLAGSSEHELGSDWRRGAMFPPSWCRASCDWRGPRTSAGHGTRGQAAGLKPHLAERQIEFVDLNRDELRKVKLKANYSSLGELWLPRAVLESDFVVSMPKVKTHHWAGVTLSLKNMFGVVPGMKYGWPKNLLHWSGIHESILDICATVPIHFVIADGITAMEGNGPLQGSPRQLGKIVLADDPVAADAICARLMGFDPLRVRHLSEGGHFLGNLREDRIRMLAEEVGAPTRPFSVLPEFRYLLAVKS